MLYSLKTDAVANSWSRVCSPRMRFILKDNLHFQFDGKILENRNVFSRVGIGMEGPNEASTPSPKFGIETDDKGEFCWLVTANGATRISLAIPLSIRKNTEEELENTSSEYYFVLYPDRLLFCHSDGTVAVITSALPVISKIYQGLSYGLKTLNDEEKHMLVRKSNIYAS